MSRNSLSMVSYWGFLEDLNCNIKIHLDLLQVIFSWGGGEEAIKIKLRLIYKMCCKEKKKLPLIKFLKIWCHLY